MNQVRLSASTIKTFSSCSYLFYLEYVLKIPKILHPALPLGTLIHLVLELLSQKNRYKIARQILEKSSLRESKSVYRLVIKTLKKHNIESSYGDCEDCILVGLRHDFECKGALEVKNETQFSVPVGKNLVTGTIDKVIVYKNKIVIRDYKSSKQKFSGEEKTANIQALLYLWYIHSLFPDKKEYSFEFIFLRFPKNPIQCHTYSKEAVLGFGAWLEYITKFMAGCDEKLAQTNFAADNPKNRWLCKAGATWKCAYYSSFTYFSVLDQSGQILFNTLNKNYNLKEGESIIEKQFGGCPKFNQSSPVTEEVDEFIF